MHEGDFMFDTLASQIGALFVVAVCGFAFLKGDEPERVVAGVFVLGWFAALLGQGATSVYTVGWIVFIVDIVALTVLGAMIWKSRKTWLIWACACQLLVVTGHVLMNVDLRPSAASYIVVLNLAGYGVLLALALGTFWAWQERRAAGIE